MKYIFEFTDITAILTVVNVALVVAGFSFAPVVGIVNCILSIVYIVKNKGHINLYTIQIAIIILNAYFLSLNK